jgi:Tfp pilus assembly protein PilF
MAAAMAAIDKNLEVYPASFSAHVSRGQILSRAGDVEGALAAFRACLAANPEISFCQSQIDRLQER